MNGTAVKGEEGLERGAGTSLRHKFSASIAKLFSLIVFPLRT